MRKHRRTKISRGLAQRSPRNHSDMQYAHGYYAAPSDCFHWLHGQQDTLNLASSSHHSCVANVHTLPVELLEYIFTFCTLPETPDNSLPHLPYPAWLPITHVRRNWRTIALNHGRLWTSITRGLSLPWIKAFMERSQTLLMDIDIHVFRCEDIILLLADFTRICSLSLTGRQSTIHPILDSLRSSLPVQSLSLYIEQTGFYYAIPNDLFGGKAPIRSLKLVGEHQIAAPHWLLRGVTHFISSGTVTVSELLDALRNMPVLAYFEFQGDLDPEEFLATSPIQMPQLMNLTVRAYQTDEFILLNQLLLLHVGAKRQMELPVGGFCDSLDELLPFVEAAGGFQHVHFSGALTEGWFRLWTGNAVTTWEHAEFCLHVEWREFGLSRRDLRSLVKLFDMLGAAQARRLVIDSRSPALQKSYWSNFLHKIPGIEEVELSPASVDMWKEVGAAAMLPALRSVRIVDSGLDHSRPSAQFLWEEG